MQKQGRLLLLLLCALAFFLLVPALVEGPQAEEQEAVKRPIAASFFSALRYVERQAGDQTAPLRIDRPEGLAATVEDTASGPDVRADANGHPLGESTYIRAVYQAFRLEEKSG